MLHACTPVLVGVTPPVLEIWLPFKNGQISLSRHGLYSPWSWKMTMDYISFLLPWTSMAARRKESVCVCVCVRINVHVFIMKYISRTS